MKTQTLSFIGVSSSDLEEKKMVTFSDRLLVRQLLQLRIEDITGEIGLCACMHGLCMYYIREVNHFI